MVIAVLILFLLLLPNTGWAAVPSGTGWYQIPNTVLNDVCAATHGFPAAGGSSSTQCNGVTGAWDGGTFDTPRNRLIIWGGGHNDYQGNEIYALDLDTLTMDRLNNPDTPQDCTEPLSGGRPASRHSASTLVYLDWLGALFNHGGSFDCSNGGSVYTAWRFNLAAATQPCNIVTTVCPDGQGTWTQRATQDPADSATTVCLVADPTKRKIYSRGPLRLYQFDDTANTWTLVNPNGPSMSSGHAVSCAFDPLRKRIYYVGNGINSGQIESADISGATTTVSYTSHSTTGCSALTGAAAPGFTFNTNRGHFMGWAGGNNLIFFNPDTNSCTTETYTGGPAATATGTFGRFQFVPSMNLAVVCNDASVNCYTVRVDAATTALADYVRRCSTYGVVRCMGFDKVSDFSGVWSTNPTGSIPGNRAPTLDTGVRSSGAGSVKFTVLPGESGGTAGAAFINYCDDYSCRYGAGDTVWDQFRIRIDANYYNSVIFTGSDSLDMKQSMVGSGSIGVGSANSNSSCTDLEVVWQNNGGYGVPQIYNNCGRYSALIDTVSTPGLIKLQNARPSPYCDYNDKDAAPPFNSSVSNCIPYYPNEWMTFTRKLTLGPIATCANRPGENDVHTSGLPCYTNSRIEGWIGRDDGLASTKIIDISGYSLGPLQVDGNKNAQATGSNQKYGQIWLLPYTTVGSANGWIYTNGGVVWYDELIVSTQAIPDPGVADTTPPVNPPSNVNLTRRRVL